VWAAASSSDRLPGERTPRGDSVMSRKGEKAYVMEGIRHGD
jgi:hypothetical protein